MAIAAFEDIRCIGLRFAQAYGIKFIQFSEKLTFMLIFLNEISTTFGLDSENAQKRIANVFDALRDVVF